MSELNLQEIYELRQKLHGIPEPAFEEHETKAALLLFLRTHTALEVADCGSYFYAYHKGSAQEDVIAFRADFDAVNGRDGKPGHYCGHDGHASVLAGLAVYVDQTKPSKNVLFLFQPAEETGQGAKICREILKEKKVSEIYGFHNVPGFEKNSIVLLEGTFACASTGLEITITGSPSHAAYPENGKNPAALIATLILEREAFLRPVLQGLAQITVIGVTLGSDSYGVSASEGVLRLTIRAEKEAEFRELIRRITEKAEALAAAAGMQCRIRRIEQFPATENHAACIHKVEKAAKALSLRVTRPDEPFRWSEDFGYYLQLLPGAFFGIGDGKEYPQLHTEDFEFPDEIMETAVRIFAQLLK